MTVTLPNDLDQSDPRNWTIESMSVAEKLALLPREEWMDVLSTFDAEEMEALKWDWDFHGRPDQKPPDAFSTFVLVAGRGVGKTRAGTEWVRSKGPQHAVGLIIGANPRDVRDIVLEGPSGVITISPPWDRPVYEPTKLLLRWKNGAVAHVRSAEDPGSIRGVSAEYAYCDELVKWRYLQETWDQSRFALREGTNPQTFVTTTPMPLPLIRKLVSGEGHGVVVAPRISTFRNMYNLAPEFLEEMRQTYEGTRLGRQELYAEILDDVKGAMWNHEMVEAARVPSSADVPFVKNEAGLWVPPAVLNVRRKVVGVDPSGSSTGDECGIVVCGTSGTRPPVGYVLDDRSMQGSPDEWAAQALRAYFDFGCELVVGEVNFGAQMVDRMVHQVQPHTFHSDPKKPWMRGVEGKLYPSGDSVRFHPVRGARGLSKHDRAVPIVGFFEQNMKGFRRVWLVGNFAELETQLTTWVPPENADDETPKSSWSPDRLDAMNWALLHLMVEQPRRQGRSSGAKLRAATL